MTFLYKDSIFADLLIKSGVFSELTKQAQQVNDQAKLIATKLAKNLMEEATHNSGIGEYADAAVYAQDLVDLDSYLNFLQKNEQRFKTKLIVYHDVSGASPPPPQDINLYTKYKDFYVIKDGLLDRIHQLDVTASQAGNELIRPFLKNLIEQMNNAFGLNYKSQLTDQDKSSQTSDTLPGKENQEKNKDPNYKNVSLTDGSAKKQEQSTSTDDSSKEHSIDANTALQNALDNLPFSDDDSLSPFVMQSFITNMSILISKVPALAVTRIGVDFTNLSQTMSQYINMWTGFIGRANAPSYLREVPYDRGNKPYNTLQNIFRTDLFATEAAQRLLQMVILTRQALSAINKVPQLVNLISPSIISNQLNKSQLFEQSLSPHAR